MGKPYFLIVLFSLMLPSCGEDVYFFYDYSGQVTAIKNNEVWNGEIYAFIDSSFHPGVNIIIDKYDQLGSLRESLHFYKIPFETGVYEIHNTTLRENDELPGGNYTTLIGGDVIDEIWNLNKLDPTEDYIRITEIEEDRIKGRFQASFVLDTTFANSNLEFVTFTNGMFETEIQ